MAEPGTACIFGSPLMEDGQTVKSRKKGNPGNKKYKLITVDDV